MESKLEQIPVIEKYRSFRITHYESCYCGAELDSKEIFDIEDYEKDSEDENNYHYVDFLINQNYRVYYLETGSYDTELLKEFPILQEAIVYAKQQYFLFTGNFPFIVNSELKNPYKLNGLRIQVPIPKRMKLAINSISDKHNEYLIIISDKHFESHSLDRCAIWD
jgi:hypothetical protein